MYITSFNSLTHSTKVIEHALVANIVLDSGDIAGNKTGKILDIMAIE